MAKKEVERYVIIGECGKGMIELEKAFGSEILWASSVSDVMEEIRSA